MFSLGVPELLVILVIVLIIFGAGKLPQIGEALGRGIRNFKKATKETDEIDVTPKETAQVEDSKASSSKELKVPAKEAASESASEPVVEVKEKEPTA